MPSISIIICGLFLLSYCKSKNYKSLVDKGGVIVDVRSSEEYAGGHIEGSINIPVGDLISRLSELEHYKNIPVITCCASGIRSARAKSILKSNDFEQVHNGGAWSSLQRNLK